MSAIFAAEKLAAGSHISRRMHARFALLMRLQEMRHALDSAEELELDQALEAERAELLSQIADLSECGREDIAPEAEQALAGAKAFLGAVAAVVGA